MKSFDTIYEPIFSSFGHGSRIVTGITYPVDSFGGPQYQVTRIVINAIVHPSLGPFD
jgi:hypothetical protein